ncbi:helix-turn-helix transcriptional regulator [Halobacterium sp. MBLA0001]
MRQALLLLVALACLVAVPVGAGGSGHGPAPTAETTAMPAATGSGPQSTVDITVEVTDTGDAHWNVSATYPLGDGNGSVAFDRVSTAFEAGETSPGFSAETFKAAVPGASARVGREMSVTDVRRASRIVEHDGNETGVLTLRFTWTNFAAVDNETITVDAFSGSWFGDLRAGQQLRVRPPENYQADDVSPNTNVVGGAYQWEGGQAFAADEPSLVFVPSPGLSGTGIPATTVGAAAVVLGAAGVTAWAYSRSTLTLPGTGGDDSEGATGPAVDAGDGGESPAPTADDPEPDDGGGDSAAEREDERIDPELLSDEERVERLLTDNGGRMKQSRIVEETRWSTAKVSQVLSGMDEDGRVEKLRIGRENLISLPGEGVDSDTLAGEHDETE